MAEHKFKIGQLVYFQLGKRPHPARSRPDRQAIAGVRRWVSLLDQKHIRRSRAGRERRWIDAHL